MKGALPKSKQSDALSVVVYFLKAFAAFYFSVVVYIFFNCVLRGCEEAGFFEAVYKYLFGPGLLAFISVFLPFLLPQVLSQEHVPWAMKSGIVLLMFLAILILTVGFRYRSRRWGVWLGAAGGWLWMCAAAMAGLYSA